MKRELLCGFVYVLNIANFELFVHLQTEKLPILTLNNGKEVCKPRRTEACRVFIPKQSGRTNDLERKEYANMHLRHVEYR